MIRRLVSGNILDIEAEFEKLGINVSAPEIKNRINPSLLFKVSGEHKHLLDSYPNTDDFVFWAEGKPEKTGAIVSFSNRTAVLKPGREISAQAGEGKESFEEILACIDRTHWEFSIPNRKLVIDRPLVMGILNITPDSFSDGGQFLNPEKAYRHTMEMMKEGADMIDIGAESTRPGAEKVDMETEWERLKPVLRQVRFTTDLPISIDTYKAEIARRALDEGADIINDISGLTFDPKMKEIASENRAPVILMHIKGTPRDMQRNPAYENMMEEIFLFLNEQYRAARSAGIQDIIIDPGIGFGKRYEDNFEILRRLEEFRTLGCPVLVGSSRKSFIGKALDADIDDRQFGTAATVAISLEHGANIIRVHDVKEMKHVAEMVHQIKWNRQKN